MAVSQDYCFLKDYAAAMGVRGAGLPRLCACRVGQENERLTPGEEAVREAPQKLPHPHGLQQAAQQ